MRFVMVRGCRRWRLDPRPALSRKASAARRRPARRETVAARPKAAAPWKISPSADDCGARGTRRLRSLFCREPGATEGDRLAGDRASGRAELRAPDLVGW